MLTKDVLISMKTFASRGPDRLQEALQKLKHHMEVRQLSSVFKVSRKAESYMSLAREEGEETLEGFSAVVSGRFTGRTADLAFLLSQVEDEGSDQVSRRALSLNLLAVDSEILNIPQLTLPHPEFHLRPEELIPACELWPDYQHPILKESLRQIAQGLPDTPWGEFHCQGQSLLDKSSVSSQDQEAP